MELLAAITIASQPDNVLLTAFLRAKITDFGTSRAKDRQGVTMTAVGTPLFCAPEVKLYLLAQVCDMIGHQLFT